MCRPYTQQNVDGILWLLNYRMVTLLLSICPIVRAKCFIMKHLAWKKKEKLYISFATGFGNFGKNIAIRDASCACIYMCKLYISPETCADRLQIQLATHSYRFFYCSTVLRKHVYLCVLLASSGTELTRSVNLFFDSLRSVSTTRP